MANKEKKTKQKTEKKGKPTATKKICTNQKKEINAKKKLRFCFLNKCFRSG
jgi:hypothetical protein